MEVAGAAASHQLLEAVAHVQERGNLGRGRGRGLNGGKGRGEGWSGGEV